MWCSAKEANSSLRGQSAGYFTSRLGLVLLVTAAIIATIFLVPGVALGLSTSFDTSKNIYKVGDTVVFDASIVFDASAQEEANIQAVILNVQPATSTKPGSESFTVNLPFGNGSFDITDQLPLNMQVRGSTLEVDVTWTDLGPAVGGYTAGYKGSSVNARIDFVVRWLPPILRETFEAAPPPLSQPEVAFPNPNAGAAGAVNLLADLNLRFR